LGFQAGKPKEHVLDEIQAIQPKSYWVEQQSKTRAGMNHEEPES
jgi:hypothetical protein